MTTLTLLGSSATLGINQPGGRYAYQVFKHSLNNHHDLPWTGYKNRIVCTPLAKIKKHGNIVKQSHNIRKQSYRLCKKYHPFVFISGDHANAMGLWGGVQLALAGQKKLGLLWIDAHLDAHNLKTSPSGNIHGMPVAGLLGRRDNLLQAIRRGQPKLKPEQLCLIATRSYEWQEKAYLRRQKVRVFTMRDIRQRGLEQVLRQAINYLKQRTDVLGISLDLDAITPQDAPGVNTPVMGGLSATSLLASLQKLPQPCVFEVAEYNPLKDQHRKTNRLIHQLINALYFTKDQRGF